MRIIPISLSFKFPEHLDICVHGTLSFVTDKGTIRAHEMARETSENYIYVNAELSYSWISIYGHVIIVEKKNIRETWTDGRNINNSTEHPRRPTYIGTVALLILRWQRCDVTLRAVTLKGDCRAFPLLHIVYNLFLANSMGAVKLRRSRARDARFTAPMTASAAGRFVDFGLYVVRGIRMFREWILFL